MIRISEAQVDQLIARVRQQYPDWQSFNHAGFVADEIDYKQEAAQLMQTLLSRTEFEKLLNQGLVDEIINRLEKVAQATNLL